MKDWNLHSWQFYNQALTTTLYSINNSTSTLNIEPVILNKDPENLLGFFVYYFFMIKSCKRYLIVSLTKSINFENIFEAVSHELHNTINSMHLIFSKNQYRIYWQNILWNKTKKLLQPTMKHLYAPIRYTYQPLRIQQQKTFLETWILNLTQ